MPTENYGIGTEFWQKVLTGIGLSLVYYLGRKSLRGIKIAYNFYQERKNETVTYIIGFRQLVWIIIGIIILAIVYLFIESSSVRTAVKDIIGNAETQKEQTIHLTQIDTAIFKTGIEIKKINLHIDSLMKIEP